MSAGLPGGCARTGLSRKSFAAGPRRLGGTAGLTLRILGDATFPCHLRSPQQAQQAQQRAQQRAQQQAQQYCKFRPLACRTMLRMLRTPLRAVCPKNSIEAILLRMLRMLRISLRRGARLSKLSWRSAADAGNAARTATPWKYIMGETLAWLHRECLAAWEATRNLDIPPSLDRRGTPH